MRVYGIDFTSRPTRSKPITCLRASVRGELLAAEQLVEWRSFEELEEFLVTPGPWIAGIDFPFGQARRFIETAGWPKSWQEYVAHAQSLGRAIQAAWAWRERENGFGMPEDSDRLEGWIADPALR